MYCRLFKLPHRFSVEEKLDPASLPDRPLLTIRRFAEPDARILYLCLWLIGSIVFAGLTLDTSSWDCCSVQIEDENKASVSSCKYYLVEPAHQRTCVAGGICLFR